MSALRKNTTVRAAVALLAVLLAGCLLSACGSSSSSSGDPQALLDDTFSSPRQIESADVDLSLSLGPVGSSAGSKSLALRLSGPFEDTGAGKLPRFALRLEVDSDGHTLPIGATSTGSALYVQLAGNWFETPPSTYTALQQSYAQATKSDSNAKVHSTFASLGIDPGHWLTNPTEVGTSTVGGEQTVHLTAQLDVPAMLADLSKFSQATSSAGLSGVVPGSSLLSPSASSELSHAVSDTRVDVYTGKSDHVLRRLELSATVASTSQTHSLLGGLSSAQVKLALELANIGKPQTIAAPAKPESYTQMAPALEQLLGTLQGIGGGSGSGGSLESLVGG